MEFVALDYFGWGRVGGVVRLVVFVPVVAEEEAVEEEGFAGFGCGCGWFGGRGEGCFGGEDFFVFVDAAGLVAGEEVHCCGRSGVGGGGRGSL